MQSTIQCTVCLQDVTALKYPQQHITRCSKKQSIIAEQQPVMSTAVITNQQEIILSNVQMQAKRSALWKEIKKIGLIDKKVTGRSSFKVLDEYLIKVKDVKRKLWDGVKKRGNKENLKIDAPLTEMAKYNKKIDDELIASQVTRQIELPVTDGFRSVLSYVDEEAGTFDYPLQLDVTFKDGTSSQLYFSSQEHLDNFNSGEGEQGSDNNIYGGKQIQSASVVYNAHKIVADQISRSLAGQGNDLQSCEVIDNDLVYIPPSGQCLFECLVYALGEDQRENILSVLESYAISQKISRHNFRQCDLNSIAKLLDISINCYRHKAKRWRYPINENQICVGIAQHHYFLIKDKENPTKCYKFVDANLIWTDKTLSETSLETQVQNVQFHQCQDVDKYRNCYVFDLETYKKDNSWFQPYACGFLSMNAGWKNRKNVGITKGQSCIFEMLCKIDALTKKKEIITPKGKKASVKNTVMLFGHNTSKFDSYFFLQILNCKVTKMIQKGGIMSMTITSDEFKNTTFIVKDTIKFIDGSLKKLCKSYQVPSDLRKGSMNHNTITESNWLDRYEEWFPYLQNDVLSLAYIFDQFTCKMRSIMKGDDIQNETGNTVKQQAVDIKQYCSIAQLAYSYMNKKCFPQDSEGNSKQLEFFTDPVIRNFIQRGNRGGRVIARKRDYRTKNIQQILDIHDVKSIDELIDEKDSEDEEDDKIIKQLLPETVNLVGDDYQIAFDATSLYPSAMALEHATFLDPDTTQILTKEQCDQFDETQYKKFIIECDLVIPKDLQFVPLSIKIDKETTQFSTGNYKKVVVNDVDLRECLRFDIKIGTVYQGIYSEPMANFMREFVLELFNERMQAKLKEKVEAQETGNKISQVLSNILKLIMNSGYGKLGQKDTVTEVKFTTKEQFFTEIYDDSVQSYFEMLNGQICYTQKVQLKKGQQQSPNHIAGYILAYSKQIMNNFVLAMGAHKNNLIYYMDTDSFYVHSSIYKQFLREFKDELGGGKNDYGNGKYIIQGHYLACKQKICYVLDTKNMTLEKKVTWKGIDSNKFKDISQSTIQDVIDNKTEIYMPVSQWKRCKEQGVQFGEDNLDKKLGIQEYVKKMAYCDGVYEHIHLE